MLLNRLLDHVFTDGGILEKSQVTAALGLLKKVLPDLSHSTGEVTHNFVDELTERLAQARASSDASRTSKPVH